MLNKVRRYIETNDLLTPKGRYIVALSGGADSVALLLMMLDMGYKVEAAHCNFHLRGDESNRDERFVASLCKSFDIPLHIEHFDTIAYSKQKKISIEMAARELRYGYFSRLKREIDADAILVAHHKDDSVETILINLVRGTGAKGLTGIRPKNGDIIRPLLCIGRKDILNYLETKHQDYVTDSTNLEDDVVRNKIRLNIIPQLEAINPAFADNVMRTAGNLTDALEGSSEDELFKMLQAFGFNGKQIRQVSTTTHSGKVFTTRNYELLVDRNRYIITPRASQLQNLRTSEPQKLSSPLGGNEWDSSSFSVACFDANLVKLPLRVRRVRQGDKFVPLGMKGKKLLSDFLTDQKVPLTDKQRQLVVTDADDNILWVVNRRIDNRYRITPDTEQALVITAEETDLVDSFAEE
ncbi:MAG: tRNA lysidine(34) synthetase TilS [Bacteroidaceae bacterium]|nr:tRNA lysidine(34) synthetase TilS [Bacteroidaceae bacterium]